MKRLPVVMAMAFIVLGLNVPQAASASARAHLLMDVNPKGSSLPRPYASSLAALNGSVFFAADDGVHGLELWKTDGTETGTVLVKDIRQGADGSGPTSLILAAGAVFFAADDGTHGPELWNTDGTEAGTVLVKDVRPGADGSTPTSPIAAAGAVFFAADDGAHGVELWKTDGTEAGTMLVGDVRPGADGSGPRSLTGSGASVFFAADDGSHGVELWRSDGTGTGTTLVEDIQPGSSGSGPAQLVPVASTVFFAADDGEHGRELWRSDGTEAGTVLVEDIRPVGGSAPKWLVEAAGTVFFSALDDVHGQELWKSDGTAGGTVLVRDIDPSSGSRPGQLVDLDGRVFFAAGDGEHGRELWTSDGTRAGTVLVTDIAPGTQDGDPYALLDAGGRLVFSANDGAHGYEPWRSDWTGTRMIADVRTGARGSMPAPRLVVAGRVLFFADDGIHGREPWTTSGVWQTAILQLGDAQPKIPIALKDLDELRGNGIGTIFPLARSEGCPARVPEGYLALMANPRLTWARTSIDQMEWSLAAKHGQWSSFDIDACQDEEVSLLAEHGVTIDLVIEYWDEELNAEQPPSFQSEEEIRRYLRYARLQVRHFNGRVRYFEILNEAIWHVALPDYLNLIRRVVPVIREENPRAKIVVGGASDLRETVNQDYLFGVLSSDVMPLVDGIAFHPFYSSSPQFDETRAYYLGYPDLVEQIRSVAEAHGFSGEYLPNELEWRTPKNPAVYQPWTYPPVVAAKYHTRGIVMHRGMGMWVGIGGELWDTIRPIADVVRRLGTVLDGAQAEPLDARIETAAGDVMSYGFSLPGGERMLAVWTNDTAVEDHPGVPATLTFTGAATSTAYGIDVVNGFTQRLKSDRSGADLVVRDVLVKDYPIFIRLNA